MGGVPTLRERPEEILCEEKPREGILSTPETGHSTGVAGGFVGPAGNFPRDNLDPILSGRSLKAANSVRVKLGEAVKRSCVRPAEQHDDVPKALLRSGSYGVLRRRRSPYPARKT